MAIVFPNALPPTVKAAIKLLISILMRGWFHIIPDVVSLTTKIPPADPLIIPQISPTTSLQKLDTWSAFFINLIACTAPRIFFDAIDNSGTSEAAVTEMPIASNNIPISIIINRVNNDRIILKFSIILFDVILNIFAIKKVKKKIFIAHVR